jgi:uncharacterized protein YcbX
MAKEIGQVEALFRYPVKSMRGERLESATLGWHGLDGDRRLALRRLEERGGFPWLTASKLPELVLFTPQRENGAKDGALPTHVMTPEREAMPILGEALTTEIGRRHGAPVQMMHLKQGIFDDASLSVITMDTVREVCGLAGVAADVRRFRPNVVVRAARGIPFEEGEWLGGMLAFGEAEDAPAVAVTMHDLRCVMINIDPDHGSLDHELLKAVARANHANAGVYTTVTRAGRLTVGQRVFLH